MKKISIYLCAIIALFSCNNPEKEKTAVVNETSVDSLQVNAQLPKNFYKRLEGTIDGKPVIMQLQRAGGDFSGNYYYNGPWLRVSNSEEISKDSVDLTETDRYAYYFSQNSKNANFKLGRTESGFSGNWISGDRSKTYPIKLVEKYPEGSYKFEVGYYKDSLLAKPSVAKSPKAEIGFTYLKPVDGEKVSWLNEQLMTLSGLKNVNLSREEGFKSLATIYLKDYKDQIGKLLNGPDSSFVNSMNYYSHDYQSIAFNDKHYVTVESLSDDYTGGAHGNYASTMTVLDVQNKKQLKLNDIIKIDSKSLQKLLEKNLRVLYNIKPNEGLKSVLFDDFIKPNNNFYFNQYGLAFLYNPYEVASYAQGQIVVFIPFSQLNQYLVADFKTRMGL